MPEGFSDLGRFSEPSLLILISLAEGPKHGYAMTQDIEVLAGTRLGAGTLYGALSRLEERGLIEPLPADDRRRPYRLTDAGRAALQMQLASMQHLAGAGLGRISHHAVPAPPASTTNSARSPASFGEIAVRFCGTREGGAGPRAGIAWEDGGGVTG